MGTFFQIIRHLLPHNWMRSIVDEAKIAPAAVASILMLWAALAGVSAAAVYYADAFADESRTSIYKVMQQLERNTKALECSSQDRLISAKIREMTNAQRLRDRAADEAEARDLADHIENLERELRNLERGYEARCLST